MSSTRGSPTIGSSRRSFLCRPRGVRSQTPERPRRRRVPSALCRGVPPLSDARRTTWRPPEPSSVCAARRRRGVRRDLRVAGDLHTVEPRLGGACLEAIDEGLRDEGRAAGIRVPHPAGCRAALGARVRASRARPLREHPAVFHRGLRRGRRRGGRTGGGFRRRIRAGALAGAEDLRARGRMGGAPLPARRRSTSSSPIAWTTVSPRSGGPDSPRAAGRLRDGPLRGADRQSCGRGRRLELCRAPPDRGSSRPACASRSAPTIRCFFGTTTANEYRVARERLGLGALELRRLAENTWRAAFCSKPQREAGIASLAAWNP